MHHHAAGTAQAAGDIRRIEGGENRLARRLTVAYVVALSLIALLSGATHVLLDRVIVQLHDAGTVINIAARQGMLSQRIALLANDLAAGNRDARVPLVEAVELMERSHEALVQRDDLGISSPLTAATMALYFGGGSSLDTRVRAFTAAARRVALNPTDPQTPFDMALLRRGAYHDLLPALGEAEAQFEAEAGKRVGLLRRVQQVVFAIMLGTLALEAVLIFRPLVGRVRNYAARLYDMATRDSLTGLPNRRFFREAGERELLLANRHGSPVALLLLDIDHFKQINDTLGHAAGDAALARFAAVLQAGLRRTDIIGRLGGEEFAVLLPGADRAAALVLAEKLRAAIEADDGGAEGRPRITASIGLAAAGPDNRATLDVLLELADEALYAAKAQGRNRVAEV